MAPYNGQAELVVPFHQHHDVYPGIDVNGALKNAARGKIILITGASQGIGAETARTFARAGALGLILAARRVPQLEQIKKEILDEARSDSDGHFDPNMRIKVYKTDVASLSDVQGTVERAFEVFGRLDIVINNAAYMSSWVPIADHDPETWWNTYEVNIRGSFNVAHCTLPKLVETKGHLVLLSSLGAQMRNVGNSAYASGKHAINRIVEFINLEYAEKGVQCFAFHPGCILTELASQSTEIVSMVENGYVIEDTLALPANALVRLTSGTEDWLSGRYIAANWDLDDVNQMKDRILSEELLVNKLAVP
ncbi:short-chain dehydrogenase/reductase SDR [Sistotremastrum niveocremeum HHB9708]|uniref:Short-chain dehydrogenase/reductase SDR n=1 Tax=Sistotremastrum niveocremeum HHB9708 TaxID=1314777 RepID=A0A164Y6T6_9AGAM|nr:short-chain dehydrogenase/reductase SDR [Sistotremastrum niveocremeum HHB9708]